MIPTHNGLCVPPVLSMLLLLLLLLLSFEAAVVDAADAASDTVKSLFDSAEGIEIGGSVLAIAAIAVGAVLIAVGYRFFRATLFVVGFICGGVGLAIAIEHIFDSESWVMTASWISF